MFTGSTGFGREDFYADLEKKPSIIALLDHSSAHIPGVSRSPISIQSGQKTTIMLNAETYQRVPIPTGECDPNQTKDSVMECIVDCALEEIVTGACQCAPTAAQYFKTPISNHSNPELAAARECRFEDFKNWDCFNSTKF